MLPEKHKKKSHIRFSVDLDLTRLLEEYQSIPDEYWSSSYWGNVHCSVGMLLLKGGTKGDESDFFCDESVEKKALEHMPYLKELISKDGPFGESKYCFIFKTVPNGVTITHTDLNETWFDMYRIHIPLITNDGAFLISNEKSMHYEKGYAWSFDNQSPHGVVNGDQERVHIIFDIPYNPKLADRLDEADVLEGKRHKEHVIRISETNQKIPSYPGDKKIIQDILALRKLNLNNQQIAQYFNSNKVPSRKYKEKWTPSSIASMLPLGFM